MPLWNLPGVLFPACFLAAVLVTWTLSLRILKILKSVYYYHDFHLEPVAVYKPEPCVSFSHCCKTLVPLYGILRYSSPQFDLPTSSHLFLAFANYSLLWTLNLGFAWLDDQFNVGYAIVSAVIATSISMILTYALHSRFVDSFNLQELSDPVSVSGTELNRRSPHRHHEISTFIDTSGLPQRRKRDLSFDIRNEDQKEAKSGVKMQVELFLLMYMIVVVAADFWSLGMNSEADSVAGEGTLLQWILGTGVDFCLRLVVCGALKAVGAVPNFAPRYFLQDFGLTPNQIHNFSKAPIAPAVDGSNRSFAPKSPKDTFFSDPQDQNPATPPPSTPVKHYKSPHRDDQFHLPDIKGHKKVVDEEFERELDDFVDNLEAENEPNVESPLKAISPGKSGSRHREDGRVESETPSIQCSSRESEETQAPHNLLSPVETPRGYSGMKFFRTPEKQYYGSPERSPEKPNLRQATPPMFSLHLNEISASYHSESEPESQCITLNSGVSLHRLQAPQELSQNSDREESKDSDSQEYVDETWENVPDEEEVYMVEFLPGGIMPKKDLRGSEYDLPAPVIVNPSYRSQSLPKPQTADPSLRSKSHERQLPPPHGNRSKPRIRKEQDSWVRSPTTLDHSRIVPPVSGVPSVPIHSEEDFPGTDESLRDISNTERPAYTARASTKRRSRKEVEQTVEELLRAAKNDPRNQDYERLAEMLAARNHFRRKHPHPPTGTKSVSPYNASVLSHFQHQNSEYVNKTIVLEDPDAAMRQAEHIQELSSIYISGGSRQRSRPSFRLSNPGSRDNSRKRARSQSRRRNPVDENE